MSEAIVMPKKEALTPFTGRQLLEEKIQELQKKTGMNMDLLIIMSMESLQRMNTRSSGCEYFVTKVREMVGTLLEEWHENNQEGIATAVLNLRDFVTEGKEAGDAEPSDDN